MRFTSLRIQQFRNYKFLSWTPNAGTTVVYGSNGSGKTNLLEAMHLLSLGRSHRTSNDREMISSGQDVALIKGETARLDGRHDIEVRLYPFQKPQKRVMLFGKAAPRVSDLMGHATVVMFSPEDLRIVRDGPSARRRFMDMQLSQIRPSYLQRLKHYISALESRNALLKENKLRGVSDYTAQLDVWDEQLSTAAVDVVNARKWFLRELGRNAAARYADICEDAGESFELSYVSAFNKADEPHRIMIDGLRRARREDEMRMYTTFGPHRDDMGMLLCGKELRAFGSQGQTRSAVLSLKLGELKLIEDELGEAPTLLLDDVFSELDLKRRRALLGSAEGVQTIITCTERADAEGARADAYLRVDSDADGCAELIEE